MADYVTKFEVVVVRERMVGFSTFKIQVVPELRSPQDIEDQEMTVTVKIVSDLCKGLNDAYNSGRNDMILEGYHKLHPATG